MVEYLVKLKIVVKRIEKHYFTTSYECYYLNSEDHILNSYDKVKKVI